jgi:signal transduction histidine kinase
MLGYESPAALIGRQMHPLIHHTKADGTPYAPEQSPIFQAMRPRGRARGRRGAVAGRRHVVPGGVLEPPDPPERRGDRGRRDLPRHHRAAAAEQELQEGVRRREQFLAMLSHELRNPLAAILSATRLLEPRSSDEACREAGLVVERQANHMARLLDDLLDVARITRGRIVLRTSASICASRPDRPSRRSVRSWPSAAPS